MENTQRTRALSWWNEELTDRGRGLLCDTVYPGRLFHYITEEEIQHIYEGRQDLVGALIEEDTKY